MKYCEKCGVGIHKDLTVCPLCGKFVETTRENYFPEYEQVLQSKVECALTMPLPSKEKFLTKLFLTLLLLISAIAIVANLLYFQHMAIAHFIIFGAVLAYIDIFQPIAKGGRLHSRIIINVIIITLFILSIDLLQPGGWRGYTFTLGWPITALTALIVVDSMIIFRRKISREYFVNLYFVSAFALVPRIVMWASSSTYYLDAQTLGTVAFYFSIVNVILLTVIFYKWIREEFQRKFFLD